MPPLFQSIKYRSREAAENNDFNWQNHLQVENGLTGPTIIIYEQFSTTSHFLRVFRVVFLHAFRTDAVTEPGMSMFFNIPLNVGPLSFIIANLFTERANG